MGTLPFVSTDAGTVASTASGSTPTTQQLVAAYVKATPDNPCGEDEFKELRTQREAIVDKMLASDDAECRNLGVVLKLGYCREVNGLSPQVKAMIAKIVGFTNV